MKKRTLFSVFLTFVMFVTASISLFACSCGGSNEIVLKDPSEDENKSIKISLNCEGDVRASYEILIEEFNAVYDANVTASFTSDSDVYWQQLDSAISAKNAPDVFYCDPSSVRQFANKNGALPLDTYLQYEIDILDGKVSVNNDYPHIDYHDILSESIKYYTYNRETCTLGDGTIYAIPKDASGYAMGYNKNVINKAILMGRWPENLLFPWQYTDSEGGVYDDYASAKASGKTVSQVCYTWQQFVSACQACQFTEASTGTKYYGTGLLDEWAMHSWIWTAGGDYISADGTTMTIKDEKFVQGLQEFVDLHLKYDACQPYEDSLSSSHYDKWKNGQVAFFSVGNWDIGAYDAIDSSILDYDVMPTPKKDADSEWYTYRGTLGFAVNKLTQSPTLATRLALWLSASGEVSNERIRYSSDSDLTDGIAKGAYNWLTKIKKVQLPNKTADLNTYLADDTLRPTNKQVYADIVLGSNGKVFPSARTYNDEWWEIFYGSIGKIWAGENANPEMTVREYVDYINDSCQEALTKSIRAEQKDSKR